uniref:Movement protein n=1 Tax=Steinernema glaseri TaxID=37863 RepID=A0A1I7YC39_9BILA
MLSRRFWLVFFLALQATGAAAYYRRYDRYRYSSSSSSSITRPLDGDDWLIVLAISGAILFVINVVVIIFYWKRGYPMCTACQKERIYVIGSPTDGTPAVNEGSADQEQGRNKEQIPTVVVR